MNDDKTLEERVKAAACRCYLDYPFWGSLLIQMGVGFRTDLPTAATNGREVWINPDFAAKLTDEQLRGVLVHEAGHPALGHLWRRGHRDPVRWNVAADHAMNLLLLEDGFQLPEGGCYDRQYQGMAAEAIYEQLPVDPTPQSWGSHDLWGQEGQDQDGDGSSDDSQPIQEGDQPGGGKEGEDEENAAGRTLQDDWKQRVTQAAQIAKMQGKLSAGLAKVIQEMLDPPLPWQEVLLPFLTASTGDYNWLPPDRRFAHGGLYLPSMASDQALEDVIVWGDTSGSMGPAEMGRMWKEMVAILEGFDRLQGHFVLIDAAIQMWVDLEGEIPHFEKWRGGGGTDFRPLFDEIARRGLNPRVVIGFTDAMGSWPDTEPDYPVITVVDGDGQVPWGIRLQYTR